MKLQNAKLKMIEISDKIELGRQREELFSQILLQILHNKNATNAKSNMNNVQWRKLKSGGNKRKVNKSPTVPGRKSVSW